MNLDTPNLMGATFGSGSIDNVTYSEYIASLNSVGQEISYIRKYLAPSLKIPKKAGVDVNFPYETGMHATEISIESAVKDFPEDTQTYHPNYERLRFIGVSSTWSKLKIETTTVDIAKQTVIRQADAVKVKENELLISALNAVIGESPTAWDIDVASTGVLTYNDLRRAALKLQNAKHYASQKYPYICFVNETEAYDLLNDSQLTSNQNILTMNVKDLQKIDEATGAQVLSVNAPVPMKVFYHPSVIDNFAVMFSPYSGVAWAELQGWQGIRPDKKEEGLYKQFWTYSLLTVTTLSVSSPSTAGDTPGVVSIDIVP